MEDPEIGTAVEELIGLRDAVRWEADKAQVAEHLARAIFGVASLDVAKSVVSGCILAAQDEDKDTRGQAEEILSLIMDRLTGGDE